MPKNKKKEDKRSNSVTDSSISLVSSYVDDTLNLEGAISVFEGNYSSRLSESLENSESRHRDNEAPQEFSTLNEQAIDNPILNSLIKEIKDSPKNQYNPVVNPHHPSPVPVHNEAPPAPFPNHPLSNNGMPATNDIPGMATPIPNGMNPLNFQNTNGQPIETNSLSHEDLMRMIGLNPMPDNQNFGMHPGEVIQPPINVQPHRPLNEVPDQAVDDSSSSLLSSSDSPKQSDP